MRIFLLAIAVTACSALPATAEEPSGLPSALQGIGVQASDVLQPEEAQAVRGSHFYYHGVYHRPHYSYSYSITPYRYSYVVRYNTHHGHRPYHHHHHHHTHRYRAVYRSYH